MKVYEEGYTVRYDLREDGASLLPEGMYCSLYPSRYGDSLCFTLFPADDDGPYSETPDKLLVRPNGEDIVLSHPEQSFQDGFGDWLLFVDNSGRNTSGIGCFDVTTGESWRLENDVDWEFYSLSTDGELLYSCVPWSEEQTLWRLECDETGRPVGLALLEADIAP